uniref:Uncharacterized protein n=1 Tax=Arundo donax TaxID=35708 RepID=A0A0A9EGN0_ARUDO
MLQMVSELTLAVSRVRARQGVRTRCAWRVGPTWSRHGMCSGTG